MHVIILCFPVCSTDSVVNVLVEVDVLDCVRVLLENNGAPVEVIHNTLSLVKALSRSSM